jgi:hypothetical protein
MPRPVNSAGCSRDIACVGEREMHPVSSAAGSGRAMPIPCPLLAHVGSGDRRA